MTIAAGDATAVQVVEGGPTILAVPHGIKKLAVVLVKFSDDPDMHWSFLGQDLRARLRPAPLVRAVRAHADPPVGGW